MGDAPEELLGDQAELPGLRLGAPDRVLRGRIGLHIVGIVVGIAIEHGLEHQGLEDGIALIAEQIGCFRLDPVNQDLRSHDVVLELVAPPGQASKAAFMGLAQAAIVVADDFQATQIGKNPPQCQEVIPGPLAERSLHGIQQLIRRLP